MVMSDFLLISEFNANLCNWYEISVKFVII